MPTLAPTPDGAPRRSPLVLDIVCGVDGSRRSYEAVRQAAALAGPGGRLTLVAVTAESGAGQQHTAAIAPERARRALAHAERVAAAAGVSCEVVLDEQAPSPAALLERSRAHGLLAIGPPSVGRLASLIVGGTASAAAHLLPASVLVARRPPPHCAFPQRILVATDALEHSDALVDEAIALARDQGAELLLLHAIHGESSSHPTRLGRQVERVTAALGERAIVRIEPARARELVVRVADEERCALIVLASRRLGGLRALGSVSERIVHDARCSVLVLRPEDLGAAS